MSEPAIAIGGTKVNMEGFGHGIIVPINPQSHLMYYLSCVNTLLKKKGEQTDREMRKLCDYKNYHRLTDEEVDKMILLCFLLSPDVLLNKCVFISEELTQDYDNNFFEISAVSNRFVITRDVMVGGERRTVQRIMACRKEWLDENWIKPMEHYQDRLQRIVNGNPGSGQRPASRATSAAQPRPAPRQRASNPRSRTTQSTSSNSSTSGDKWCSVM